LVLVDRGHRELPIHPDYIGKSLPTASEEQVKVYLQDIDGKDAVELIKA
jgi:pyrimidine operon attenuation protein/uracil phosphoribosyltransferase